MAEKNYQDQDESLNIETNEEAPNQGKQETASEDLFEYDRYRGLFGRWRLMRDKNRARFRRWWTYYLENIVPKEDDDAPENLPKIFHGQAGRLLLGAVAVIAMAAWVFVLWLVWSL
ncbi:hypothetical protein BI49514_02398 [Brevibacterium iodinum ATCC 49514]|uniref:Uncharacterized protein n=1 Tax=Brevibacterium iodinum ATCC 49514 TaxID=1255616 RepID=A0A2H1JV52_9MICO|nr:hypothetical protein [Brevibacterium iodinum]SMX91415.1 hypothetical protein BI49514_02398 [Brevibacterium iodinum ATCC 49514]SUW70168.1 Uncharacterised protein [Brevibacterium iodinum]